jgi:polyisoprenyl-phosphate glycosyltransferase
MSADVNAPEFSVVVPVFNSAETVEPLFNELAQVFDGLGRTFEVLFVNDCSRDGSAAVLKRLAESNPNVTFVDLLRNFGQQNATLAGMSKAQGKFVITLDDDLQNPPDQIPLLIKELEEKDLEAVYGIPDDKKHQAYRNVGSSFIHGVLRRLFPHAAGASSFRLMSRTLVEAVLQYRAGFPFLDGLIHQNTSYVGYVPVRHEVRAAGTSGYNFRALLMVAMNLFFNFSIAPLRFVFVAGLLLSAGAGLFAVYILIGKLTGVISYPGYASIMVYVSLLFGALFMFLGLIGEYVGRIAQGVNRSPQYAIRKVVKRD